MDTFKSNGLLDSSCKTQTKLEKPLTQKQPFVHYSLEFSFDALSNKKSIYKEKTPVSDISLSPSLLSSQSSVPEEDQKTTQKIKIQRQNLPIPHTAPWVVRRI